MDLAWKKASRETSLSVGDFFLGGVDGGNHLLHRRGLDLCFFLPGLRCLHQGHKIAAVVQGQDVKA